MLYPRESESRQVKDLGGIWRFRLDPQERGFAEEWWRELSGSMPMPVPSSYNDITQDPDVRDHIGWAWYQRELWLPEPEAGRRLLLRFGSATHTARVWFDGIEAARHKGGYLPFEADVTEHARAGRHTVTVAVSNVLDWTTLPPGEVRSFDDPGHPAGFRVQKTFHDFFNYAGLHRPVQLVSLPAEHIRDIVVTTALAGRRGTVGYRIEASRGLDAAVRLLDPAGREVAAARGHEGELFVEPCTPWAPGRAFLYALEAKLLRGGATVDVYRLPVGIRTVAVEGGRFLINGEPFYFKGACKHEDADIRGKAMDPVLIVKDFNLLRWMGANSFRTSHYPYSEELMNLADEMGFAVIDETPAVGLWDKEAPVFVEGRVGPALLEHHLQVLTDLVARDRNHPSVVMWSVANEPACWEPGARDYFARLIQRTRQLDPSRPVTVVQVGRSDNSRIVDLVDVVCINRYYGWYSDPGRLEVIEPQLRRELLAMHENSGGRPVMVTEYGADTIAGLHQDPPVLFSEEYQAALLAAFHRVMDSLDFVVGEHVWNFADFQTVQEIRRVDGNKKGIFTRDRRPKAAAHMLRSRWRGAAAKWPAES